MVLKMHPIHHTIFFVAMDQRYILSIRSTQENASLSGANLDVHGLSVKVIEWQSLDVNDENMRHQSNHMIITLSLVVLRTLGIPVP